MASQPRIPTATYRLQLNRNFTFNQASEIIPYLARLGISDIYSSPFYRSRPDSPHGYDVTNHNELNPAIGTLEDFAGFTARLKEQGMGHITDFVPNIWVSLTQAMNGGWMFSKTVRIQPTRRSLTSIGNRSKRHCATRFCFRACASLTSGSWNAVSFI